jgi:hypothetical protein
MAGRAALLSVVSRCTTAFRHLPHQRLPGKTLVPLWMCRGGARHQQHPHAGVTAAQYHHCCGLAHGGAGVGDHGIG